MDRAGDRISAWTLPYHVKMKPYIAGNARLENLYSTPDRGHFHRARSRILKALLPLILYTTCYSYNHLSSNFDGCRDLPPVYISWFPLVPCLISKFIAVQRCAIMNRTHMQLWFRVTHSVLATFTILNVSRNASQVKGVLDWKTPFHLHRKEMTHAPKESSSPSWHAYTKISAALLWIDNNYY